MDIQHYFNLLNDFFDRIYVITLRRATDRHAHIEKELKGLNYEFFYGKDKQEFVVEELKAQNIYNEELAIKHHRWHKPMPAGMIGCSWSHKLVYEDVIKNGYSKVLVLEDDVVIDKRLIQLLPEILKELPKDWEVFYFGFAENELPPSGANFKKAFYHFLRSISNFKYSHKTIKNLYPKKVSKHIYKSGYHDCTHAYGITLSAARMLYKLQTPISFFPDNLLAYACTNELVKGYITLPKLINQQYQVEEKPTHSYINE